MVPFAVVTTNCEKSADAIVSGDTEGLNNKSCETNDPECFETLLAKYGKFKGVVNYIAIVGKKNDEMAEENAGYYGERIVLKAQMMRLNTCWVGGTYGKGKCK